MVSHVYMITCAYEQGVGKGHQAFNLKTEITINPYIDNLCNEAWWLGYKEGKKQAERLQKFEPVGEVSSMPGTPAFSMACFPANSVPAGTKLYTHAQQAIPPGYKLVPVEPTKEMVKIGDACWQKMALGEETYRAMIAAAPEAPATGLNLNCKSEQAEPVCEVLVGQQGDFVDVVRKPTDLAPGFHKLYTHPHATLQLTDEQIDSVWINTPRVGSVPSIRDFARAILNLARSQE